MPTADWPEHPKAKIGPTGYGTFGIVWSDFPAMERRGGYSGPYDTFEQAEASAQEWAEGYGYEPDALIIERVASLS